MGAVLGPESALWGPRPEGRWGGSPKARDALCLRMPEKGRRVGLRAPGGLRHGKVGKPFAPDELGRRAGRFPRDSASPFASCSVK